MASQPDAALQTMIRNLHEKTGKTLDEWVRLVRRQGLGRHGEQVAWLKTEHGLGHGYANLIAQRSSVEEGGSPPAGDDLVAAQFAGKRAGLAPIYAALVAAVQRFGADVEIAPKKTYVSVRRSKQFAIFQASTADRFDVGIQLMDVPATERLEASGSFNAMVSHRVRLSSVKDVDRELLGWLRQAYDGSR